MVIGIDRYFEIQRAIEKLRVLRDAFPFLEILQDRHENGTTYYMSIETPEVRIAINKTDSPSALPSIQATDHQ